MRKKFLTRINFNFDGEPYCFTDFQKLIKCGKFSQATYDSLEDAVIDFIISIMDSENVMSLKLVINGVGLWYYKERLPQYDWDRKVVDPNHVYKNGKSLAVDQMNDFIRLGIRGVIDFGATDRKGHFIAFVGDGFIDVGHTQKLTSRIPKKMKKCLPVDDISKLLITTDYYEMIV